MRHGGEASRATILKDLRSRSGHWRRRESLLSYPQNMLCASTISCRERNACTSMQSYEVIFVVLVVVRDPLQFFPQERVQIPFLKRACWLPKVEVFSLDAAAGEVNSHEEEYKNMIGTYIKPRFSRDMPSALKPGVCVLLPKA